MLLQSPKDPKSGPPEGAREPTTIRPGHWLSSVLIIDDKTAEAASVAARLHLLLGYDIRIEHAKGLGRALDFLQKDCAPNLIMLDDVLPPTDRAPSSIAFLRRAGYHGPIIVVGGLLTTAIIGAARAAGAIDVIHKDDLDTARLLDAIGKLTPPRS
ncbi:MAG TPA: response regulator [Hyphomicrobiaceae bacterium]|nr:response regulator [Hyphomicrobiaceae bacterium]